MCVCSLIFLWIQLLPLLLLLQFGPGYVIAYGESPTTLDLYPASDCSGGSGSGGSGGGGSGGGVALRIVSPANCARVSIFSPSESSSSSSRSTGTNAFEGAFATSVAGNRVAHPSVFKTAAISTSGSSSSSNSPSPAIGTIEVDIEATLPQSIHQQHQQQHDQICVTVTSRSSKSLAFWYLIPPPPYSDYRTELCSSTVVRTFTDSRRSSVRIRGAVRTAMGHAQLSVTTSPRDTHWARTPLPCVNDDARVSIEVLGPLGSNANTPRDEGEVLQAAATVAQDEAPYNRQRQRHHHRMAELYRPYALHPELRLEGSGGGDDSNIKGNSGSNDNSNVNDYNNNIMYDSAGGGTTASASAALRALKPLLDPVLYAALQDGSPSALSSVLYGNISDRGDDMTNTETTLLRAKSAGSAADCHAGGSCTEGSSSHDASFSSAMARPPLVPSFPIFTAEACEWLMSEFDHARDERQFPYAHNLSVPNNVGNGTRSRGMGVVMADLGLDRLSQALVQAVLSPMARLVYPRWASDTFDSYHAFSIHVEAVGMNRTERAENRIVGDRLPEHIDVCEVSMNICLGRDFEGSDVHFTGVNGAKKGPAAIYGGGGGGDGSGRGDADGQWVYHRPGWAFLNLCQHFHSTNRLERGQRHSIVVRGLSSTFRRAPSELYAKKCLSKGST